VPNLPLVPQRKKHGHRVLDRDCRIDPMQLVEVDAVDT
jgi:hypothetical protein